MTPLRLTRDDVRGLVRQGRIAPVDLPPDVQIMESTARHRSGRRADLGGLYVRSSWEANRARWLTLLKARGTIRDWTYESRVFKFRGITRGCREYRPDFTVLHPNGRLEFEEVKANMDQKSKTRLKRMAKYYPGVTVTVIGREWFVEMEKSGLAGAIPHWERL
jgi:hypothetical protein